MTKDPDNPNGPWSIQFAPKNFGQTAANIESIKFEKFFGPRKDAAVLLRFTANADNAPVARIPPQHFHTLSKYCPEIADGAAGWNAAGAAGTHAYILVRVEYEDVFEKRWYLDIQMFCPFGETDGFEYCHAGNGTGPLS